MIKYNTLSLSIALARAEFKLKNEGTYLGVLWYLSNPLLYFLLLLAIFSKNLGSGIPQYPLYIFSGLMIFHYFRNVTIESTRIIYDHRAIVKSIPFPYQALIGSVVVKTFFSHILEILLFALISSSYHPLPATFILYPILLLVFMMFTYGFSLALACCTVFFMDLEHIWSFFSQLLWFATPLFYALDPESWLGRLNIYNPLYHFITMTRQLTVYGEIPALTPVLCVLIFSIFVFILGHILFQRLAHKFPEAM